MDATTDNTARLTETGHMTSEDAPAVSTAAEERPPLASADDAEDGAEEAPAFSAQSMHERMLASAAGMAAAAGEGCALAKPAEIEEDSAPSEPAAEKGVEEEEATGGATGAQPGGGEDEAGEMDEEEEEGEASGMEPLGTLHAEDVGSSHFYIDTPHP